MSEEWDIDPSKYPLLHRAGKWSEAIGTLTDPEEMRQYVKEYGEWIDEQRGDGRGKEIAMGNIGYAVGYFSHETADRWFAAIEDLSHPIFGRTHPSPEAAFSAGMAGGKASR